MSDLTKRAIPEAGILGRIIDKIAYVFAAGIVLAACILLLEVFLRYVFNSPTLWAHETTTFLCGLAFLYGGLLCVSRDSHIRVVLLYDAVGPRARRWLNVILSILSLIATGFFAFAAWIVVTKAYWTPTGAFRMETSGSAWNPPTPALVKGFLLIIILLMMVQFLILSVKYFRMPADRVLETEE
ncbi:TRAP transporter small permease subunit [Palleronia sp. LCG004]|uniref:TRAP transporter small permease subunit n=1 Tax=Palleronia sp. LCG004 TaxID=3079304 RepID=UPI0029435192|nr:TRAP transporter small permease subunit [Palleronia sp. LCG004]WOI56088.1 TRAP transporter small permease subunit [Palleronia sp. LCG004]